MSLSSALSPFLKPIPWGGQAQLGELPGLPRKHCVLLRGDFLFDFFFVFWKYCHGVLGAVTGFH